MKATFQVSELKSAWSAVAAVVPKKSPKLVLQNIRLAVGPAGETSLVGTDGDIGMRHTLSGVEVEQPGVVLLPPARVGEILREMREESVTIEVTDRIARIETGWSHFEVPTGDADEFPAFPDFPADSCITLDGAILRELVRRTIFATDNDSTRYALGGILFEVSAKRIGLVATDTRRLALAYGACQPHDIVPGANAEPIVPAKAMSLVERALSDVEGMADISITPGAAAFRIGPVEISSRLIEGRFPKYQAVMPKKLETTVDLICGPLYAAIRQALIMTSDESRGVDFTFSTGKLTLNSRAMELGNSRVELPIPFDGGELTIRFDPRFIADALKVLGPERQITLGLNDGDSSALLKTDDVAVTVIMPLQRDR